MGLGGFLAARSDADAYRAELARERREIVELPERERLEVRMRLPATACRAKHSMARSPPSRPDRKRGCSS